MFSQELDKNICWEQRCLRIFKKYVVDKLCAEKELRMIGVEFSEVYERQLINAMEAHKQQRLSFKKKREDE